MAKERRISKGNSPKGEASKRIGVIRKDIESYRGGCLFPANGDGDLCTEPPSRCHVIPRSSVLNKLKDEKLDDKVFEFDWGVNQWAHLLLSSDEDHPVDLDNPATFEPRRLGTHEACTGPFGCEVHDKVFKSIDTDDPDFGNPAVRRLAIGRAVLYAADLASKRKFLADKWNSRSIRSTNRELRFRWRKEKELTDETHQKAYYAAEQWRNIWQSAGSEGELPENIVDWCALTLRSTLRFAACLFYGQATVVMVLPGEGEHHKMTLLYFREDSEKVKEDKERLAQMAKDTEQSDAYGVTIINELIVDVQRQRRCCGFPSILRRIAGRRQRDNTAYRHGKASILGGIHKVIGRADRAHSRQSHHSGSNTSSGTATSHSSQRKPSWRSPPSGVAYCSFSLCSIQFPCPYGIDGSPDTAANPWSKVLISRTPLRRQLARWQRSRACRLGYCS